MAPEKVFQYDQTDGAVPKYVLVGSNFHTSERRSPTAEYTKERDDKTFPFDVTLGFRGSFWRVFSSVIQYDHSDFDLVWLGRNWRYREMWVCESRETDLASYLDDPVNVFVLFMLEPLGDQPYEDIRSVMFRLGLDEQKAVDQLISALTGHSIGMYMKTFKHVRDKNALFSWTTFSDDVPHATIVSFVAFYSFALLMTWRIHRDQMMIDLHIDQKEFQQQIRTALHIRTQIINVKRFFMTKNISNNPAVQRIAGSCLQKFSIGRKLEGFLELNESIERHLTTAAQLRADAKSTMLNITAFLIAAIGLPISIISMLVALNSNAEVIKYGSALFFKGSVSLFLFLSVVSSVALIALSSYVIFRLVRWLGR